MKHIIAPRMPLSVPGLAWAAPVTTPVRAATVGASHAVLHRTHAPGQLTLPLQARPRG